MSAGHSAALVITQQLLNSSVYLLLTCVVARYALPRERGILRLLPSPSSVTTQSIIQRIVDNRAAFEARNAKKVASEEAYYSKSKDYVQEL